MKKGGNPDFSCIFTEENQTYMSIRDLIFGKKKVESSFHLPERSGVYYLISGRRFNMDQDQYEYIKYIIEGEGYDIFYVPDVLSGLGSDVMKYNFPGVKVDFTQENFSHAVGKILQIELGEHGACLVWYDEDMDCFKHSDLQYDFEALHVQVYSMFNSVLAEIESDIRFRISNADDIENCCNYSMGMPFEEVEPCMSVDESRERRSIFHSCKESLFDLCEEIAEEELEPAKTTPELDALAEEAQNVIRRLLLSGFSAEVIKGWLEPKVKLSRIRITKRYKILLVDYDMEVKMGPLPKTVFLFFLRHPEGMRFVDLQDYKQEIYDIYSRLAVSDDLDKIERSVDLLTNPFDNSINEKCTMIKYAFQKVVADDIASNYYVSGKQGHTMKIPLDRALVEWE